MAAIQIFKRFRQLLDVDWTGIADGQLLERSGDNITGTDAVAADLNPNLQVLTEDYTVPANKSLVFVNSLTLSNNSALTIPSTGQVEILGQSINRSSSYADAPNRAIPIGITPNILVSRDFIFAAGDQVTIKIWGAIFNNSGNNCTYSYVCSLGTLSVTLTEFQTQAASATFRGQRYIEATFSIASTSSAWVLARSIGTIAGALGTCQGGTLNLTCMVNQHSSSNLTGIQVVSVKGVSTIDTATQNFEVHSWTAERRPTQP